MEKSLGRLRSFKQQDNSKSKPSINHYGTSGGGSGNGSRSSSPNDRGKKKKGKDKYNNNHQSKQQ
jgi:hypothetical protein